MEYRYNIKIATKTRNVVSIENFKFARNKITFLFGESGIGKTLISKAIYGLLDDTRLEIWINGLSYSDYCKDELTRQFQRNGFFVFQEPSTHLNPLIPLGAQLREGSLRKVSEEKEILKTLWDNSSETTVREILKVFPKPYRPSGGEKQRILLAMALKKIVLYQKNKTDQPALFVFDEPSGSLDNHFRNIFLRLLFEKFSQSPFTSLFITHDYSIISEVFEQYPHFKERVDYQELRLTESGLQLEPFAPGDYLEWLKTAKPLTSPHQEGKKPVFTIESGYQVFGKTMTIHSPSKEGKETDLTIHSGEIVYLKAPSGVGKTTLAKIVMGLMPCENFSMVLDGEQISHKTPRHYWHRYLWGKKMGMVFQHADEALNLNASVEEVFSSLPLQPRLKGTSLLQQLRTLFTPPPSATFLKKKVALLSGGQKQRLNLLRTMVLDTQLLILDEPLNGLDFLSIQKVLQMIYQKQKEGKAILLISHNEDIFDTLIPGENIYYLRSKE
ncbi:MAG: ATP-binding cassette domain-containing protein [Calditrichaeota bacterium]|nr:MAG: ATP-binding cassette domain-containing protein [Calditrichota bacterium]